MRFTDEVLQLARKLTAKAYPCDAGSIYASCLVDACRRLRAKGKRTLIIYG